ncbi:MAG: citrate lyase subunit alpha [Spirochaetes bacterium]|nr:citrate lyase subunit alpha [Spirochaetota bacterium]MBU1081814.1 citrate lyase subunit alpha [Spirochaetota bacterium]
MTVNSIGRDVPASIDGRPLRPFAGAYADASATDDDAGTRRSAGGPKRPSPGRGRPDKIVAGWDELLDRLDLKDGSTISFHHHLRDGDAVINEVVGRLAARGLRDLTIAPTALFPVHDRLVPYIESGVIARVEGSMNGAVGAACSRGAMRGTAVLRSHGGRQRAIQDGDLHIDAAFIAAPCADPAGNANGLFGKSACGPLAYPVPDSLYADRVAVITDGLVPYPCAPRSISGGNVDWVLEVESIGDASKIVSGTTRLTRSPTQLLIAELTARFIEETGVMRDGFSFQAGAGGISLAAVVFLAERMRARGVKASFAHGGATGVLASLLEEGLLGSIVDLQSFDLEAVRSCRDNLRHIESTPFDSYGPRASGSAASMLDIAVLGATEVDLDFNVNVNTHSDGLLLHGIGGHTDAAASAACSIITAPSFRKRIPIVRERVTTVSCPGEAVDVVVTERGIAINPRRGELAERARRAGLPLVTLGDLMVEVRAFTGIPDEPEFGDRVVAVVEWRDGTALDVVRELAPR